MVTLLETLHGSHLYGLATPESDLDSFRVISDSPKKTKARYAKQTISEDRVNDVVVTDLSTFMLYANKGVPQYLEAMWSPIATVDVISEMRWAYRPNLYKTEDTYIRTITNFYEAGDAKRKRHSFRLVINLLEIYDLGWFHPMLDLKGLETLDKMVNSGKAPLEFL